MVGKGGPSSVVTWGRNGVVVVVRLSQYTCQADGVVVGCMSMDRCVLETGWGTRAVRRRRKRFGAGTLRSMGQAVAARGTVEPKIK